MYDKFSQCAQGPVIKTFGALAMHWHAIILQPCILRILWVQYTTCFAGEVHSRRASKGGFLDEWPSPGTAGHSCFRPAHQPPVTNQVNQVSFTFHLNLGRRVQKCPKKSGILPSWGLGVRQGPKHYLPLWKFPLSETILNYFTTLNKLCWLFWYCVPE